MDDVDASRADAGHEILTRHDWVTLHENGIRYLERARLPYWGMAVGMKLFGLDTWSVRFLLHLSALAVAISYFFAWRFAGGPRKWLNFLSVSWIEIRQRRSARHNQRYARAHQNHARPPRGVHFFLQQVLRTQRSHDVAQRRYRNDKTQRVPGE
jgi:4-amino-4-deoxy-L-arabinose transferase-like glycosyltransferase